ncbi:Fatty acid desaturase family protein [Prunus dulcis]|uniref:Fatty acid desaturase family protein n=1 Tax=Prunus dulcis TaxID=3755 RepID=A0A4Y1R701_PRUDU|nr:Fatty acid desaturase family protein [Prunus dulcis]
MRGKDYSSVVQHLTAVFFTWPAFLVGRGTLYISGVGVTLSFHRNLSHKSFKLPKWLEYLFAYCGVLSFQRSPLEWVSIHRAHHQYTDTWNDPHSPIRGLWFSHVGWALDYRTRFGSGVRTVLLLHAVFGINSICHTWDNKYGILVIVEKQLILQAVGLATDVKLPTETQKKRRALCNKINEESLKQN